MWCASALCGFFILQIVIAQIPDEQEYGPIRRPQNPTAARDILGYDSFQINRSEKKANRNIQFGNNWEKYDSQQDLNFNRRYQPRSYNGDYEYRQERRITPQFDRYY